MKKWNFKWFVDNKWGILRLFVILFAIVFVFSALSKLLSRNSKTLQELAAEQGTTGESSGSGVGDGSLVDEGDVGESGGLVVGGGSLVDEDRVGSSNGSMAGGGSLVDEGGIGGSGGSWDSETVGSSVSGLDTAGAVPVSGQTLVGALLNGELMADARVTFDSGFYYEPLSENLKRFITGISYPLEDDGEISYDSLRYLHVLHYDFEGIISEGELICNKEIADDLAEIFFELYRNEYQLEKVRLIDLYNGDDDAAVADNNTSCFNYRKVEGSDHLSKHALGLAVDINPFYNPYVTYDAGGTEHISPAGSEFYADRSRSFAYKIDEDDLCYRLFTDHGFIWGGNWNSLKDYQHFQKSVENARS